VDKESYKTQRFQPGIRIVRDNPKEKFEYVQNLPEIQREALLSDNVIKLYSDPGKGNLLTIGSGDNKDSPVLFYTSKQVNSESGYNRNTKKMEKLLSFTDSSSGKTYKELVQSIKHSAKTSIETTFIEYIRERYSVQSILDGFYKKKCFRAMNFRKKLGYKSSEDKLKHKIKKTFNPEGNKEIVMFYGDWGRNPNLKHQAPTPGIGLRRKIHKCIKTYSVNERGTSSICPECLFPAEYAIQRKITKEDYLTGKKIEIYEYVHRVLRCSNENCRIWWNRDVMGMLNIKKQALTCLNTGELNQDLLKARKIKKPKSSLVQINLINELPAEKRDPY